MNQTLLYIGFSYMILHLSLVAFKKGEQVKLKMKSDIGPQFEHAFWGDLKNKLYYLKAISFSFFSPKYKFIKIELKKPYKDYLSDETIKKFVARKPVQEIKDEINQLYEYKEYAAYKQFVFDDNSLESRRMQFLDVKYWLKDAKLVVINKVVREMYSTGMLLDTEKEHWKHYLKQENLIDENGDILNINLEEVHRQENNKIEEVNTLTPSERILTRSINHHNTKRFE